MPVVDTPSLQLIGYTQKPASARCVGRIGGPVLERPCPKPSILFSKPSIFFPKLSTLSTWLGAILWRLNCRQGFFSLNNACVMGSHITVNFSLNNACVLGSHILLLSAGERVNRSEIGGPLNCRVPDCRVQDCRVPGG